MNALNEALRAPKYQQILEQIKGDILTGRYKAGEKLPSEAALVKKFATSRITVGRALRELNQLGLIERRAGSGSPEISAGWPGARPAAARSTPPMVVSRTGDEVSAGQ